MAVSPFSTGYEASGLTQDKVADFIRSEAMRLGIDPELALRVAKTEGFNNYQSTVRTADGGRERSYGPFQLYMGGGLGNEFQKATGINPETDRSEASVKAGITYALQHAANKGWGAFHGARNNGIGNMDGIGGRPPVQGGGQQTMNPMLISQNEAIQERPQQGGLSGLFNDPGKLAALQMLMSGLNPFSKGNEMEPFIRAAQLKATQDYNRKIDERDYNLRREQFEFNKKDREADNARAEKSAGLTETAKDLIAQGYTPGTPEYTEAYKKYWQNKTTDKRNVGLNPVWGTKDGKPAIGQLSSTGEFVETKMPEGFQPSKGIEKTDLGDSWAYVDKQTGQTLRVVPKNIEAKEAAEERGKALGQAQVGLQGVLTAADYSIKLIDDMIEHPGREAATGLSARLDPRNYVPGTDAYNFGVRAKQVEGRAFLQAFESLKGAGAITEIEGAKATQAIARLDRAQSDNEYKAALTELQGILKRGRENAIRKASGNFGGGSQSPAPASTGGKTSSGVSWKVVE